MHQSINEYKCIKIVLLKVFALKFHVNDKYKCIFYMNTYIHANTHTVLKTWNVFSEVSRPKNYTLSYKQTNQTEHEKKLLKNIDKFSAMIWFWWCCGDSSFAWRVSRIKKWNNVWKIVEWNWNLFNDLEMNSDGSRNGTPPVLW